MSVSCVTPIQVTVSGLGASNSGLVLNNLYGANSGNTSRNVETRSIPGNGTFQFPTSLPSGRVYTIGIDTEHPDYACNIVNGDSSVQSAAVNVAVTCTQRLYRVRGNVTGLGSTSAGLRLRREAVGSYPAEELNIGTSNPQAFEFVTRLPTNTVVTLTEIGEPDDRLCTFSNATNSLQRTINRADITDIAMNCTTPAPLTITNITPADNASNVALGTPITITFSHSINLATVNSSTVTLTSQYGAHPATVSVNNTVVTVTPQEKMMPSVTHTITVTTAVRGSGKEALAANQTRTFSTGTGWTAEQNSLAVTGVYLGNSQVRFDSDGRAVVLWSEHVPYGDEYVQLPDTTVRYSRCQFAGSLCAWSSAEQLAYAAPNWGSTTFVLSPIANNDLMFVMVPTESALVDRRYEARQWGASNAHPGQSLNTDESFGVSFDGLSTDEDGNAWLAYLNISGGLVLSRYTPGSPSWSSGSWSNPTAPFPGQTGIRNSTIQFRTPNDALLIFTQMDSNFATTLKCSVGSLIWSAPIAISTSASEIRDPRLKIDATGNAIAVWLQDSSVYSRRYWSAAGWAADVQPLETVSGAAQHLQLTMDTSGVATAVWSQNTGARFEIYGSRLVAGTWTQPHLLSSGSGNAEQPKAAIGADGSVIVVWLQGATGSQSVYANRFTAATNQWGTATRLDTGASGAASHSVDIRSDGVALAVWIKNFRLFVSRFE